MAGHVDRSLTDGEEVREVLSLESEAFIAEDDDTEPAESADMDETAAHTTALVELNKGLTGAGSFDQYVRAVYAAPVLTAEEEWELSRRIREENDMEAAQRLVFSNLRHVVSIVRMYQGYGLPMPDLVQEGNVGLLKAVKRFDEAKKVRLMTFAVHWIRAEIHDFIIRNWRIVKMATTKSQRKLFFKLRSSKKQLGWLGAKEAQEIADKLDVSVADVHQMDGRLNQSDASFDAPVGEDDEAATFAPAQYLPDNRFSPEQEVVAEDERAYQSERLQQGLESLDARSRDIVERRWVQEPKATFKELAEYYNISIERVRQLEEKAFKKMRQFL